MKTVFYIKDYLHPTESDSVGIARCIADARKTAGQKTVIFDGRDFNIDEAILLPSDTHVIVDSCAIRQKDGVFDNIFRGDNLEIDPSDPYGYPLNVTPIQNIIIEGRGHARLVGTDVPSRGYHPVLGEEQDRTGDFWGWRTLMISLSLCDSFEISGLSLSQTMCWAMSFDWCCGGYIHDIDIRSAVKNGDGVDFRSGCHHCRAENITGCTSDDTVACTALYSGEKTVYPYKNYLYTLQPAEGFTEGLSNNIHHIEIRNIRTGGNHHGVICLAAWGNQVHHITIDGFSETEEGERESTVKIYTGYGSGYTKGDIHHITVRNIRSRIAQYAVQILAEAENVETENITQENPNGVLFG